MNTLAATIVVLGFGIVTLSGTAVHAQFGDIGDAAKQGATDAVKERVMKDTAEQAGVPVPGAAAPPTTAAPDAAPAPVDAPEATGTTLEPEATGTTLEPAADVEPTPTTTLP
jgi:hypothetical protein